MKNQHRVLVAAFVIAGAAAVVPGVGCGGSDGDNEQPGGGSSGAGAQGGAQAGGSGGASAGATAGQAGGSPGLDGSAAGAAGSSAGNGGGSAGSGGSAGAAGSAAGMGGSAAGEAGAAGNSAGGVATDANLKVAFIGDTADGPTYKAVLSLIKREQAHAIAVAGDMTYTANAGAWWTSTEEEIGTSFPVFLARGNHDDSSWSAFLPKAANHLGGGVRTAGPHDSAYKTVWKGLSLVAIRKDDGATVVKDLFKDDKHIWKVCYWHHNQTRMQLGGKGDEAGWGPYEACREVGAIVITAHEHSYQRTKTLTNMTNQTIDAACSSGDKLCVGPGRSFVTVTGLGGNSVRAQTRCLPSAPAKPFPSLNTADSSCPMWAAIQTSNQGAKFGAQFIVFNVDGNPRKARGYFKNVDNETMDEFEITAD